MRKVVVSEFMTVDGIIEDPGGSEGTEYGGWSFKSWSDESAKYKLDEVFATDALLLGRVTYQGFAAAWPSMKDEQGFADRMNSMPKYVVSTTLQEATWNNSTLIKKNVAEEVAKLKQQPDQDIMVSGGAGLVHTLRQHNLIDEYRLMIHPIILGSGKRLFSGGIDATALKLIDSKALASGVVILTYQPASTSGAAQ